MNVLRWRSGCSTLSAAAQRLKMRTSAQMAPAEPVAVDDEHLCGNQPVSRMSRSGRWVDVTIQPSRRRRVDDSLISSQTNTPPCATTHSSADDRRSPSRRARSMNASFCITIFCSNLQTYFR